MKSATITKKVKKEAALNSFSCEFEAKSANEAFARFVCSSFASQLDPTVDELTDIKTAVSEAVTNCIVHGYRGCEGWITLCCKLDGDVLHIRISDDGRGIDDLEQALTPFYTSLPEEERSGMGFTIMQTFMTAFSVSSEAGKGTIVTMSKQFGARATEDAR